MLQLRTAMPAPRRPHLAETAPGWHDREADALIAGPRACGRRCGGTCCTSPAHDGPRTQPVGAR